MHPLRRHAPVVPVRVEEPHAAYRSLAGFPPALLEQWLPGLETEVIWANAFRQVPGWSDSLRVLPNHFLLLIVQGGGMASLPGSRIALGPGDLLSVPPRTVHALTLTSGPIQRVCTLHFHARLRGAVDFLSLVGFPGVLRTGTDPVVPPAMKELARLANLKPAGWRQEASARLRLLLIHFLREYGQVFEPHVVGLMPERAAVLLRLMPAIEHIQAHLGEEIRIADLAECMSLGGSQLRLLFRKTTGEPVVGYIRQRRIDHACHLLLHTTASLKEIAGTCGFTELSYFFRVFKEVTGLTPRAYREKPRL